MNDVPEQKPETARIRLTGMTGFTVIWIGQMFSLLGTSMTAFTIAIWAWQITQEVTALTLFGVFSFAPLILMSPIVGALGIVVGFGAWAFHAVRDVEDILPDYDAKPCTTENENQPII